MAESTKMADDSLFDSRTLERNLIKGRISREEYEAYLASLEDLAEDAGETSTRMSGSGVTSQESAVHHEVEDDELD